jgi:predicted RNase H-like HicB family nuclease
MREEAGVARMTYPAMIEVAEDSYGVNFPDLPGCVSFAETADDAVRNAEEALNLHLEGMAEDAEPYPAPTPFEILIAGRKNAPTDTEVVWVAITAEAPDEAERVNLYLTRSLLQRVDAHAKAAGINRSAFFNQAARAFMASTAGPRRG